MPRVSYVVTVYNKAPYLPYVVEGLTSQLGEFEREFIFVNDGSSDGSLVVLRRLTAGLSDCRIIEQPNRGPAIALNAGLEAARGDLIKTLDGDDMLTPRATVALLDALHTTEAGLAFGPADSYDPAGGLDAARRRARELDHAGKAELVPDPLRAALRRAQTTTSSWLARAELVRSVGGCDPGVFVQDYSIELRLARAAAFARVPPVVYLQPSAAPGRQSEQGAQELHDLNLAIARFIEREARLPLTTRRYALRRAAGRAWHYARRDTGKSLLSREFWHHLRASLGVGPADAAAIRATCEIFRATSRIKMMEAP